MRYLLGQLFLIGLLVLTACDRGQPTPETFSSETGQFSIATPEPFEETQQSVQTPVGPVEIHTFTAETGDSAYVVAYSDYPEEIVDQTDPQVLLNSSRDGAVGNLGGTLISESELELEGHPGRALVIRADAEQGETATISSHIYLVDNRLYQVLVVAPENSPEAGTSAAFLDSFDLQ
ncbi:MAG: hypothetical protein ACFBSG_06410 [Leptolyngbyaceae cyanobacterium]